MRASCWRWGVVLIVIGQAACSSAPEPPASAVVAPIGFTERSLEKKDATCAPAKLDCTAIQFRYPDIVRAPSPAGRTAINQAIKALLVPAGQEDVEPADYEGLMADFISKFEEFKRDFPGASPQWSVKKIVTVVNNTPAVFAITFEDDEDMGGARPNASRTSLNFNPETGERLGLPDVLMPGADAQLNALAEQKFRAARKIAPGQKLSDAGFTFDQDRFKLNDNFSIGAAGVTFHFNAYEVGPYDLGSTDLLLDYAQLRALMKKAYLPRP